jgi:hypothetical protein
MVSPDTAPLQTAAGGSRDRRLVRLADAPPCDLGDSWTEWAGSSFATARADQYPERRVHARSAGSPPGSLTVKIRIAPLVFAAAGCVLLASVAAVTTWVTRKVASTRPHVEEPPAYPVVPIDVPPFPDSPGAGVDSIVSFGADETVIAAVVTSTADRFDVPRPILEHVVRRDMAMDPRSGVRRFPPAPAELISAAEEANRLDPALDAGGFLRSLGADLAHLDSHLARRPEIGVALRAVALAGARARIRDRLRSEGFEPEEATAWLAALLALAHGAEVDACVKMAAALDPQSIDGVFSESAQTAAAFRNPRFVLRAFLTRWDEETAKRRRQAFVEAVVEVIPLVQTLDDAPVGGPDETAKAGDR